MPLIIDQSLLSFLIGALLGTIGGYRAIYQIKNSELIVVVHILNAPIATTSSILGIPSGVLQVPLGLDRTGHSSVQIAKQSRVFSLERVKRVVCH